MVDARESTVVWLRRDLRLDDNPALSEAVQRGAVIPVYIYSPNEEAASALGGAAQWWLHESLAALAQSLAKMGSRLIIRRGAAATTLKQLVKETKADGVVWNRCYDPSFIERDGQVKAELRAAGCRADSFNAALLYEPWTVSNKSGDPYRMFTPFWRACLALGNPAAPMAAVTRLPAPTAWPDSLNLEDLELKPKIAWDVGFAATWTPGEVGVQQRLRSFMTALPHYIDQRDVPSVDGTSQLSAPLAFGEISPRRLWATLATQKAAIKPKDGTGAQAYLRQLGWREFAYHLLFHFPTTVHDPLRPEFAAFPWQDAPALLNAWQRGQTGYPLVDAGMRQLWHCGWMHNRVRMVVGSFLVKHLLLPWQAGAQWFWDTLVDADLANNTLGWQWIAGCGADAAPYFRIFNPTSQGERWDPEGVYIKHWVPELARLPAAWVQQPAAAPSATLRTAGVELGGNYPLPVVEHGAARFRALHAYEQMRRHSKAQPPAALAD